MLRLKLHLGSSYTYGKYFGGYVMVLHGATTDYMVKIMQQVLSSRPMCKDRLVLTAPSSGATAMTTNCKRERGEYQT